MQPDPCSPHYGRGSRRPSRRAGAWTLTESSGTGEAKGGQVFGDEILAPALLDRLLHYCDAVSINVPSRRLKHRLAAIERDTNVARSHRLSVPRGHSVSFLDGLAGRQSRSGTPEIRVARVVEPSDQTLGTCLEGAGH